MHRGFKIDKLVRSNSERDADLLRNDTSFLFFFMNNEKRAKQVLTREKRLSSPCTHLAGWRNVDSGL